MLYLIGIAVAVAAPLLGLTVYAAVAVLWLVPDRRMERMVETSQTRMPADEAAS